MEKDNYLREVLGLEFNDSFPSRCLKKGRELNSDYTDCETITPIINMLKIEGICTTNVEFLEILLSILSFQSSIGLSLSFLRKQESSIFVGVLDSRFRGSDR